MDYISRQKQWEAEQARIAANATAAPEEDETVPDDGEDGRFGPSNFAVRADAIIDADMVEQVLSQEDRELQALVALMEDRDDQSLPQAQPLAEYGSDDDDFDNIFMEAVNAFDAQAHVDAREHPIEQDQEMDLSND